MKKRKFNAMDLSLLCHQMEQFIKSGVSPLEGIPEISEEISNNRLKKTMELISKKVVEGASLYQAFSEAGRFPDYMLQMIRIGELTGKLDTVMEILSNYYENESDLIKEKKNAITYPIVLLLLIIGIIGLMIFKVIPVFIEILQGLGGQMPQEVQLILLFSIYLNEYIIWVPAILVLIVIIIKLFGITKIGKYLLDGYKIKNPFTGKLNRKIISYRLGMGLALATESGMNLIDSFNLAKILIENRYVAKRLDEVSEKINDSEPLSDAIKSTNIFSELFSSMIKTAEQYGTVSDTMKKLTRIYGKEAEVSIKKFRKTLEPTLVAILSAVLGIVLLSILLPIIGIMSSIG
ncbi:MAG: type II secretion system F family protein [Clostridiaceae bacterium]|nr:type II secretion system F family protein [Clostridiaceae bacterium]